MPYAIAMAGKGGTGKTTIAGFLIKYLVQKGKTPVLAVDADSNTNLNEVLGVSLKATLGTAREEMKDGVVQQGMTKQMFMEMKLSEAVVEGEGFDLIAMGRPEGAGCYCAANSLLSMYLGELIDNYPYMVMDNEAGMEHISRLTTNNVDVLLVISDPSMRGIETAGRINTLVDDLKVRAAKRFLLINQVRNRLTDSLQEAITKHGLNLAGTIPKDDLLYEFDMNGNPTFNLPDNNPALSATFEIFDKIIEAN
ncbi:MAG: carbon monoxide dehydrogenase [Deltaproteobacteria bacterium]|jgi:CO dehydrogenase maturation factor|nr:MAG: carbon monoxide dehydrogenase [Deltaproteobacteria bacterium]